MTVSQPSKNANKCRQLLHWMNLPKKHMTVYDGLFNITKIKNFSYSVIPKKRHKPSWMKETLKNAALLILQTVINQ